ncbi:MAG: AMP-binding protein [Anaerovoracaceae bacterium]
MNKLPKICHKDEYVDFKHFIKDISSKYASNEAFILKSKINKETAYTSVSYAEFGSQIKAVATALLNRGYENKPISVIGNNSYTWLVSYYATLSGVGTAVPLDKGLPFEEINTSLIRSEAEVLFFDKVHSDSIMKLKDNNNTNIKLFIALDKIPGFTSIYDLISEGNQLIDNGNNEYEEKSIDPNETTILLFTSGTTSMSKIVMLSQNNILENLQALQCSEYIYESDRNLAFLPFHHTFGSTGTLLMLATGMSTAFCDGLKYLSKNLVEYKITIFFCVPLLIESIYKKVIAQAKKDGKDKLLFRMLKLSNFLLKFGIDIRKKVFASVHNQLGGHLRLLISGASAIDKVALETFLGLGITTIQGYGLTETSPVLTCENNDNIRIGSVGKAMFNVDLKINNPDSQGIGEVYAKGPNIMSGYYENPEETNKVFDNGWFNTGDLGYIDKDGYLFLSGRSKNVVVLKNGKNVYPEEIEILISNLPYVAENMVFGIPKANDENDLILGVKIVYNKDYIKTHYPSMSKDQLTQMINDDIDQINNSMPVYKHLHRIIITDEEMIKTSTAKVKRHEEMKNIREYFK